MEKREKRRDRTIRIGESRRKLHLERIHPTGVVDCVCEFAVWRFAKRKALGCGCRGRQHGNPRMGHGTCVWGYRPSVEDRRKGRRLEKEWIRASRYENLLDVEE